MLNELIIILIGNYWLCKDRKRGGDPDYIEFVI